MPTYEYACRSCGKHHDVVQSFGDDPLTECPDCSGPLRKVFGSVGVVFKGSGFYKTDSRAAANGKKTDKDRGDKDRGDKDRSDKDRSDKEKTSTDGSAKDGASAASSEAAPTTGASSSSSSPSSSPSSKPSKPEKTAGTTTAAAS